jgi:hypothetical protein
VKKRKGIKRLSPDEQQALMHKLSGTQQAEATKVAQATDEAPPTKRGRPKKS